MKFLSYRVSYRLAVVFSAAVFVPISASAQERGGNRGAPPVSVRFVDSATGYAVQPEQVRATRRDAGTERRWSGADLAGGRGALALEEGRHTLTVISPAHKPMVADFEMSSGNPYRIEFHLDPLIEPREVQPEYVASLHREEATVFVGFVVDDDSGLPLAGVLVRTEPSGAEARTDERGYFQIYVPVQTREEAGAFPAALTFTRAGYRAEERRYLELWSEGDWIYRIRLERGAGRHVVDERQLRRRSEYPLHVRGEAARSRNAETSDVTASASAEVAAASPDVSIASVPPLRIPVNIRVLRQDLTTIDYVSLQTYCQRSLPSEWIASWGNTGPGGSGTNSLNAGAVAIRTYAIGFINNPSTSTYDICGTTACQAYVHTAGNSLTTTAVNYTANWVMVQPGAGRIGFKITEYSAENNSLGFSCGDGYTQPTGGCIYDPVCTGETRFGHGRGMCQWGTARWASGRRMANRVTGDSVTNGYPLQTWTWLCQHYYPNLELVQGAPLMHGDYVKVMGTTSLSVRACADGSISSGVNCPQLTTRPANAAGVIIGGPVRVTADGVGFTWWRVQWHDAESTIGWSAENWLERTVEPVNVRPVLAAIANRSVNEGSLLIFTNSATAPPDAESLITDFEGFANGTSSGTVMFRQPSFSGSTSAFMDASPNTTTVTGTFPAGQQGARVLRANWSWNSSANAWLRLTTSGTANLPNPVLHVGRKLIFDIHTDKALRVGVGVRETGNATGTPIGSDGGASGGIEFVGVTNVVSSQPQPTRTVSAGAWTTLVFDLPNEPVRSFSGGNNLLSTATGLGVLEHLAFVPAAGSGAYNVYLDNFIVSTPKVLTYSLSNAPPGATIHPVTGVFTWTPGEAQGPGVYTIGVVVTDNNLPPLSDSKTFTVTVNEVNSPPVLAGINDRTLHAGSTLTFTNAATDPDLPANTLSYSLDPAAPAAASVHPSSGVFTWTTTDVDLGTNAITVRVTDNGVPPLSDAKSFTVAVLPRPSVRSVVADDEVVLTWNVIAGTTYQVQFKNDLSDPSWTNLGSPITATEDALSVSDPADVGQRFYRVVVVD